MSIVDRIHAYKEEKSSLKHDIFDFYAKVAKYTGVSGRGTHNNGWRLTKTGDYYLNTFIDGSDPIPYIETYWEYADCGSDAYGFPAHWMDIPDAEWQREHDDRVATHRKRREAQAKADAEAAQLARDAMDRSEYERLKKKFGEPQKEG